MTSARRASVARAWRSLARWLGLPARAALVGGIRLYRVTVGGLLGGQCRFHPSCSHYAEAAIRARGALAGSVFAFWRIARCQPFGRGGLDPAPAPLAGRGARSEHPVAAPEYEAVIHSLESAA